MQKSIRRLVLAVATHPSTVKVCALYTFRFFRLLSREAGQTPEPLRWFANEVSAAWTESVKEAQR
jgi:hypothetical protein